MRYFWHGYFGILSMSRLLHVVPALDDDEHVVDADSEEEEGEDVVHGREEDPQGGAGAVSGGDAL